jgi:SAM-dependent methyltransferase
LDRRAFLSRALALAAGLWRPDLLLAAASDDPGNFRAVYLDPKRREEFYPFLQNVFHLYPEKKLQALILAAAKKGATDRDIYEALLRDIPSVKTPLSEATYMLPSLKTQKAEMTRQALSFLGTTRRVDGYLEIGTTGRYVSELKKHVEIAGPVYLINDVAPSYKIGDMAERGEIAKIGAFFPMGDYDPVGADKIPDASLDLVVNLIGFHHSPKAHLEGFVRSIHRVLKPGGRLLLRDHDVDSPRQDTLVALAHDVFNAGLFFPWKYNHEQVRLFRSLRDWSDYLKAAGFTRSERALAQDGDPTKNLMVEFAKA